MRECQVPLEPEKPTIPKLAAILSEEHAVLPEGWTRTPKDHEATTNHVAHLGHLAHLA